MAQGFGGLVLRVVRSCGRLRWWSWGFHEGLLLLLWRFVFLFRRRMGLSREWGGRVLGMGKGEEGRGVG